jgi:hypothetical protein
MKIGKFIPQDQRFKIDIFHIVSSIAACWRSAPKIKMLGRLLPPTAQLHKLWQSQFFIISFRPLMEQYVKVQKVYVSFLLVIPLGA